MTGGNQLVWPFIAAMLPAIPSGNLPVTRVCIVAAARTPQGRFLGGLASVPAARLGAIAAEAALARAGISTEAIDQVIVGNVLGAGLGQNIARQIAIGAKIPHRCPAFTVT